jgi:pyruvate ferredoxin oxidoreductase alpha subunit
MNCYDGFITSHAVENIELIEDDKVKAFVGKYEAPNFLLNSDEQIAVGPLAITTHYFEHKRQQAESMRKAKDVILEVSKEFAQMSGRSYGLFEEYKMEDAEKAIVVIGSTAGTSKFVVDSLRAKGEKVGLIKIRMFRPFPAEELAEALKNVKAVAIMDKCDGFNGKGGPLFTEVSSALLVNRVNTLVVNYIYGLGGRDVKTTDIEKVYSDLTEIVNSNEVNDCYRYLGVVEA